MHGLMMDMPLLVTPLLVTGITRFAARNFAAREVVPVTHDGPRDRASGGRAPACTCASLEFGGTL